MISCVLLSAGLSQRYGSPKALVSYQDRPLICQTLDRLLSTQVSEIIIVLGAQAEKIKPAILNHKRIKVVYNKDYKFGQTSSLQTGLKGLSSSSKGVMVLPVDYPFVAIETFQQLLEEFSRNDEKVIIPVFHGKKGHPPIFPKKYFSEFLALDKDQGMNVVSHQHPEDVLLVDTADNGVVLSFNTLDEWKAILQDISETQPPSP